MTHLPPPTRVVSSCWPVIVLGLAFGIFLGWQILLGVRQFRFGLEAARQQEALSLQSAEAERNFRAMMMELIDLSETNPEARRIIKKYNVKFTPDEPVGLQAPPAADQEPEPSP